MIRVLIADDHAILRRGLINLLSEEPDLEVVGEAADGFEAVEKTLALVPDILLVDMVMPHLNGLAVTNRLKSEHTPTRIIILSMRKGEPYILEALRSGADGYVLKSEDPQDLIDGIRVVASGSRYLSPKVAGYAVNAYINQSKQVGSDPYDTLTAREKEVLQLSAEGMPNEMIAEHLSVSISTISTHRRNLMSKLNIKNQGELIKCALEHGVISSDF